MEIITEKNGTEATMVLKGRLDTNAAPDMAKTVDAFLTSETEKFILDMADCDYVASSGLRVILNAQKKMNAFGGTMVVKNVIGDVMEVFEMTGFADILVFE